MLAGMLTVSLKSIQQCKNKIVMTALRHMRYKVSYAFFALKIRKMEDMKMSEAMENPFVLYKSSIRWGGIN